ncbi:hypothetical protein ACP70R_013228 [Stipagrostis hirtigluma subsp. patula]
MEMNELDNEEFYEDTKFCPHCNLPLYPKDDKKRFFLLICRSCAYESQLDFEFTWEKEKVNGISILPPVKRQEKGTCFPNAVITVAESQLKARQATKKKKFVDKLSVDNVIEKYEKKTGRKFGEEKDQYGERIEICRKILKDQGVVTKEENDLYKVQSFWKRGSSFTEISELLLKRNVLLTNIPLTVDFYKLSPDDIYIADQTKVKKSGRGGEEWHAIVLVGFGVRNNEKYFRFMNSWGTKFCDAGFGSIRALEVKDVLRCELKD